MWHWPEFRSEMMDILPNYIKSVKPMANVVIFNDEKLPQSPEYLASSTADEAQGYGDKVSWPMSALVS